MRTSRPASPNRSRTPLRNPPSRRRAACSGACAGSDAAAHAQRGKPLRRPRESGDPPHAAVPADPPARERRPGGYNSPPAPAPPTMIDSTRYPHLSRIESPSDLRTLGEDALPAVAEELRAYLIESVGRSGGHFGAGLGVIELTVALHYLYETPDDRIVWDVGHQAYPHKILTGRRDAIHTVKQKDGVAPFPKDRK